MMQAFHEIASIPGFDDLLEETMDRVSAIESLGRTRELVAKDLVLGGTYKIGLINSGQGKELAVTLHSGEEDDDDDEKDDDEYTMFPHGAKRAFNLEKDRDQWRKLRSDKYKKPSQDEHS